MHHRVLGKSGVRVSVLGAGSSQFRNGPPELCAQLLEQAVDLGITYYDTARSYKHGEEAVGYLSKGVKDRLVIATKTGARGGKHCLRQLQESLNTTKRGWIDVWMTHMVKTESEYDLCVDLGGFCDIAAAAKNAGLIRASGASFHAPTHVIRRAIEERAFDVVMFQLNLISRETVFGSSIASYRELLPIAQMNGVGVVVMKVLAGGEMRHGIPALRQLTRDIPSCSNELDLAIRYATMNPAVGTAVVGMSNTAELVANAMAVEGVDDAMEPEFNAWTDHAQSIAQGQCTRCGLCLDVCPEKIEIPKVFRLYDQQRFFGMNSVAQHKYASLEINASACRSCKKCQEACPEDFDIASALIGAHQQLSAKAQVATP